MNELEVAIEVFENILKRRLLPSLYTAVLFIVLLALNPFTGGAPPAPAGAAED